MVEILVQENQRRLHVQFQSFLSIKHVNAILACFQKCSKLEIEISGKAGKVLDLSFDLESLDRLVFDLKNNLDQ